MIFTLYELLYSCPLFILFQLKMAAARQLVRCSIIIKNRRFLLKHSDYFIQKMYNG